MSVRYRLVRVSPDRLVVERGERRLIAGGLLAGAAEHAVGLLNQGASTDLALTAVPGTLRPELARLLAALEAMDDGQSSAPAQHESPGDSRTGPVALHGVNPISVTAQARLAEAGIDTVLVPHPALDTADHAPVAAGSRTADAEDAVLVLGTSTSGLSDELFRLGAQQVARGRPFLPAWSEGVTGLVGPLYDGPRSPCLRCFALRRAANDPRPEVSEAVRRHRHAGQERTARLPVAMLAVVGELCALQVCRRLGNGTSGVGSGVVEINLVSFAVHHRPVLPVPYCPVCSASQQLVTA